MRLLHFMFSSVESTLFTILVVGIALETLYKIFIRPTLDASDQQSETEPIPD